MDASRRNVLLALLSLAAVGVAVYMAPQLMSNEKAYPEGKSYMKVVEEQQKKEKAVEFWKSATPEEALRQAEPLLQEAVREGKITAEQAEEKRRSIREGWGTEKTGVKGTAKQ